MLFLLLGCDIDSEVYISRLEKVIGVQINEQYTVLEKSSSNAVGDFTEVFHIQFNQPDFEQIMRRLDIDKFEESNDQNFLYINKESFNGDKISVIVSLKDQTIKYTYADI